MRRAARDPYWITAKFPGRCAKCGADVPKGDRAFYYPNGHAMLGGSCGCGGDAAREFEAARQDEAFAAGGY